MFQSFAHVEVGFDDVLGHRFDGRLVSNGAHPTVQPRLSDGFEVEQALLAMVQQPFEYGAGVSLDVQGGQTVGNPEQRQCVLFRHTLVQTGQQFGEVGGAVLCFNELLLLQFVRRLQLLNLFDHPLLLFDSLSKYEGRTFLRFSCANNFFLDLVRLIFVMVLTCFNL